MRLIIAAEEHHDPVKIDFGAKAYAMNFSTDGESLLIGGYGGVEVWRVADCQRTATMESTRVRCLAVSNDGKWIAAGTIWGEVIVWDAKTYKRVLSHEEDSRESVVNGVDFSPDSTRLVTASNDGTASVWDVATCQRVRTLRHQSALRAAKYSPPGDRIAIATQDAVLLYDSSDGRCLFDIVTTHYNTSLLWFNNHLFIVSNRKTIELDAFTGTTVSEWPVDESDDFSRTAQPRHGGFIIYSTGRTVSFRKTSTHSQLCFVQHPRDIYSIAVSPDDRFLAIAEEDGKITIKSLSDINVSCMHDLLEPTLTTKLGIHSRGTSPW